MVRVPVITGILKQHNNIIILLIIIIGLIIIIIIIIMCVTKRLEINKGVPFRSIWGQV